MGTGLAGEPVLDLLRRQVEGLRQQVQRLEECVEVLQTPWWKRWFWFVPQGWLPYRVGRWY